MGVSGRAPEDGSPVQPRFRGDEAGRGDEGRVLHGARIIASEVRSVVLKHVQPRRFTVEEFKHVLDSEALGRDERVELVNAKAPLNTGLDAREERRIGS